MRLNPRSPHASGAEKNDSRARPTAQKSYLLKPTPEAADTLGWILVTTGNPATGLALLRQANAQLPRDPAVAYHLAVAMKDTGHRDEATKVLTAIVNGTVHGRSAALSGQAQIELIKQPNPFILHGDPAWLSIDLRMFVARPNDSLFGVPPLVDANDAPRYVRDIITALNMGQGSAGGQSFEDPNVLSPDEKTSSLFMMPTDSNGTKVFNFALAKVHYIGLIGANDAGISPAVPDAADIRSV
jgi:hypothetical protein